MDDLLKTFRISAAGMKAQGTRLRVVSENIANANNVASSPGDSPYERKTVIFKNKLDKAIGLDTVRVHRIAQEKGGFKRSYEPGHPHADENGYVLKPNVNSLIEMMDMREAQRSYQANVSVIKASRGMIENTIDVLK